MNRGNYLRLSLVLPALHLCLCIAIELRLLASEGSWTWFLPFLVDFPFSILLLRLENIVGPFVTFAVFGTAWWFLISSVVLYAVRRARNRGRAGTERGVGF